MSTTPALRRYTLADLNGEGRQFARLIYAICNNGFGVSHQTSRFTSNEVPTFPVFAVALARIGRVNEFVPSKILPIVHQFWDQFHWQIGIDYSPTIYAKPKAPKRGSNYDPHHVVAGKQLCIDLMKAMHGGPSNPDEIHLGDENFLYWDPWAHHPEGHEKAGTYIYENERTMKKAMRDDLLESWPRLNAPWEPKDVTQAERNPYDMRIRLWWD